MKAFIRSANKLGVFGCIRRHLVSKSGAKDEANQTFLIRCAIESLGNRAKEHAD